MSLLFMDGFDDEMWRYGKWTATTGNPTTFSVTSGGYAWACANYYSGASATKQVAAADEHATFIVGFMSYYPGTSDANHFMSVMSDSGTTYHITLTRNSANKWEVRRGDNTGVVLATASIAAPGPWDHIELKVTLSDSAGSYELRQNGITVAQATGVDTKNSGTKTVFDSVRIASNWTTATGTAAQFDHFYICNGAGSMNNTFLGSVVIETVYPNNNGSSTQWVGSDGDSSDNYLLVDEAVTPNTADYNESTTVGAIDTYQMGNMTRTTGSVKGVQVTNYVAKSDAGTRNIRNKIRTGSSYINGTDTPLTTTYKAISTVSETDPSTGTGWTISGVNGMEAGIEVTL